HGALPKFAHEKNGKEVKKAVHKTGHSKFGGTVFAGLMLHHFLTDILKSSPFDDDGNVPMHFSIYFDGVDYFVAVCFESAVEIVERDPGNFPGGPVKQL